MPQISEIKERINHVRILASKLGNILTKEERNTIRKEMFKFENTKLTKTKRGRAIARLIELTNTLQNRQKYQHDHDYHGIRDIEHLFNTIDHDDYYKPILARSSFENNFEEYEIRRDKHKNLTLNQYLATIVQQLTDLISKKKRIAHRMKGKFN